MQLPIGLKRGYRTPFVKSNTHYAHVRNAAELSSELVEAMLAKLDFPKIYIQHVIWGMVVPNPDLFSIAREVVLGTSLSNDVEAYSVSRACATSMQAATNAALYYNAYPREKSISLVGGAEHFSSVKPVLTDEASRYFKSLAIKEPPMKKIARMLQLPLSRLLPVPPSATEYSTGLTMGEHCELMVKEFKVTRERQDRFALVSHQNAHAARAYAQSQILPLHGVDRDTLIRHDTSIEKLSSLKPAFDRKSGSITAGNASPFTDGAAGLYVVSPGLASEVKPDAFLIDFEYVGVDPSSGLLMGPGKAMLSVLKRQGIKWNELDYIDIHEAFAGQVLCNIDAVNNERYRSERYGIEYDAGSIDESKINPWGSSIAYGHPFGATGARMLSQAIAYLHLNKKRLALVAACTAGALAGACLISRNA